MKTFKKILLRVVCIALVLLLVLSSCRMAVAEAKRGVERNYRPGYEYTSYIEYRDVRYYQNYSYFLPEQYWTNDLKKERLTYCKDSTIPVLTFSVYQYKNDDSPDMLQLSPVWVSLGTIFVREDYIFPTVENSNVSFVEIKKYRSEDTILFDDEGTINKVIDCIKKHGDISNVFPIQTYGFYSLYVHYYDSPVYEHIGSISQTDEKFEYKNKTGVDSLSLDESNN